MQKYRIKIDNRIYEVEVEKIEGSLETTQPSIPQPQTRVNESLVSPIQGTILKILIKPGDSVNRGQPLFIIEAMKLENEIVSDRDGVIENVFVQQNEAVESDQILASYRGETNG